MSTAQDARATFGGPITLERLVRYAGSSGDFNPLHYDPETARAAGFERPVVVGSMTTALLLTDLIARRDLNDLRRVAVRFRAPVLEGAHLAAELDEAVEGTDGTSTIEVRVIEGDSVVMDGSVVLGGQSQDLETLPADFLALGEPFRWPVEEGQARFFARAVEDPRPVARGTRVHPAFLPTAMRWSPAARDFVQRLDFDFARLVHGSTALEYGHAPIRVGEELWVTEGHSGRRAVEGRQGVMNLADVHLIVRDEAGAVRARLTYRIVERPKP